MAVVGNTAYAGIADLPPLVRGAIELAASQGFDHSCDPAQGRLLSVLARGNAGGIDDEHGIDDREENAAVAYLSSSRGTARRS